MNLYEKYRPKDFDEIVGQSSAVNILRAFEKKEKFPHAMLFTGPSGTGKTTLARIVANKVGAEGIDVREINSADFRGVDSVREIRNKMNLSPTHKKSKCRAYIIDEMHQQTKDAQNAMLKMLEDTPPHVHFFLCTTEPNKVIAAIKSRCTEIKTSLLLTDDAEKLLKKVSKKEGIKIASEDVFDKIITSADGSPRKMLVLLEAIEGIKGSDEQLEALSKSDASTFSIDLCRALFNGRGTSWKEVTAILSKIDDEPETTRRAVLGYARAILLKAGNKRAIEVIQAFRDNYYDTGNAGLILSCAECCL